MKSPGRFSIAAIALFSIVTAQAGGGAIRGLEPLSGKTIEINLKNKRINSGTTTVNDGDTLRFCNLDAFFHKPFSISNSNKFSMSIKPGECRTYTVRNPTDRPLRLALFDDLHAFEKLVLTVLPGGTENAEQPSVSDDVNKSDDSDQPWRKALGRWQRSDGSMVFELVDMNKSDREYHPDEPIKVEGYVRKAPSNWSDKIHVGDLIFISNKVEGDTLFGQWIQAPQKGDCPKLPLDFSSCSIKVNTSGDAITKESKTKQYRYPKCEWSNEVKSETFTYVRVK